MPDISKSHWALDAQAARGWQWQWFDGDGDKPGYIEASIPRHICSGIEVLRGDMGELGDDLSGTVRVYSKNAYLNVCMFFDSGSVEYTRGGDGDGTIGGGYERNAMTKMSASQFFADPEQAVLIAVDTALAKQAQRMIDVLRSMQNGDD